MKVDKFLYSVATLVTTIVGIGIFGIPFSFVKAGFLTGILFLIGVFFVTLLINLMYGEIALRTQKYHQIIGYVDKYLGNSFKKINLFAFILAIYGALVAIIAISGTFWANVFWFVDLSPVVFSFIFFIVSSVVVVGGLKIASKIDLIFLAFFVIAILLISFWGIGNIEISNYKTIFFEEFWFLPFGITLFAFAGMSSVVLMRELMVGNERLLKRGIVLGTAVPALLYLIFTITVVGVSGEITSPDAISGLGFFLGPKVLFVGSLLGLFSTFTVFVNTATALKESFQRDMRMRKFHAQLLVLLPPVLLFASGLRNFIEIIGLVGAVAVSINMVVLIFVFISARKNGDREPEYALKIPRWVLYLLASIFSAGAVYALIFF